ncbi:MAG: hypothetical protein IPH13_03930 [Planctomycetes bacterium]|nr:hypothetical protein [Planctomycetota bacterium]MCC7168943.1 hypothetical protein [Planctomycetota bacterium]
MRRWLPILSLLLASCGSTPAEPPVLPIGKPFPAVVGTSLSGDTVRVPQDFSGKPVLLLVGFVQNAQFDLDRWLFGLLQAGTPVAVREVPTIEGLVPGMFAGMIDEGMRGGIPSEDWGSVVTVYDDAEPIADLLGRAPTSNGRIVLLDANGVVVWFHDRGYSASKLKELDDFVRAMM